MSRRRQKSAPQFRISSNGFERWIIVRAEAGDHVVIDGNFFLAPAGVANLVAKPFNVGKADTGASRIDAPASLPV